MWESQLAGPHMALGPPWAWLWPELTPPQPWTMVLPGWPSSDRPRAPLRQDAVNPGTEMNTDVP